MKRGYLITEWEAFLGNVSVSILGCLGNICLHLFADGKEGDKLNKLVNK